MKKKVLAVVLTAAMAMAGGTIAYASSDGGEEAEKSIVLISKSYQNQFYQAAFKGAQAAGEEFGFTVTTNGPDSESNISQQVDQVAAAVNQKPTAIAVAACDPIALQDVLTKAKDNGIPVIGFDSGVPDDQSGAVLATAATDNEKAGAMIAGELFKDGDFQARMLAGTEDKPAVIGILAQDSTSGSIVLRVNGFVAEMVEQLQTLEGMAGAVEVSGQTIWNQEAENPAKIILEITVPPSTTQADIQTAASTMLNNEDMSVLFAANQGAVDGLLGATSDGNDLDRENGKYKDLIVVGFDAGKGQKEAIKKEAFFGSATQDPYTMGYEAVRMANDIYEGKTPEDVDTGVKFYNSENIDDEDIAILLYD